MNAIQQSKKPTPRFPNITYRYWSEKNEFFADVPLTSSILTGLAHAKKAQLVEPVLSEKNIKTNKDLVELIKSLIQQHRDVSQFTDIELLLIFDLIQGWGGKMGRGPYCRPKGCPVRLNLKNFPALYRDAVFNCCAGLYQASLEGLLKINFVGESFATKHIFFWSTFGRNKVALPIYDTRIKTLLFVNASLASGYDTYVGALRKKSESLSMSIDLVERALFAFSQNYFGNSNLKLKSSVSDRTDFTEALKIQSLFLALKSV